MYYAENIEDGVSVVEDYLPSNPKLYLWQVKLQSESGEWVDDLMERTGFNTA